MRLADGPVERLRENVRAPDLEGTRYRLVGRVGHGGMGAVYEAEDQTLGRRVALKVVDAPEGGEEGARRLLSEARVLAALEHPGLVPVHDAGMLPDGRAFYAMKLVDGAPLDVHLMTVSSVPERLRLFLRVCEPVAFAHARGVLHRDLKPSNVMVGPFGEVLVMDWGLAGMVGEGPRETAGTPGFMAPEQREGGALDARTDVYGLGALLAALLADVPGAGAVPRALADVVRKAREQEPRDRYESVQALAADVRRFLDGERVLAHPENALERAGRLLRRHRVAALLIVAYLVARAIVMLWRR